MDAALITPLDADGHVDDASVQALVEFQVAAGVHGLLILGSTGEGPLLSLDDKLRLVRATVQAARGRLPVMVGIAHSSPAESVAFGRQAHAAGANALVTTPPFYFLSSQAELIGYFRYLRARLELPLITYDVPSAVKTKIAAAVAVTPKVKSVSVYHELSPDFYSATSKTFIGRVYQALPY